MTTPLIDEHFTGANGSPWNPAIWAIYAVDATVDIQGGKGSMALIASGGANAEADFVVAAHSHLDAYAEVTIPDVAAAGQIQFGAHRIVVYVSPASGAVDPNGFTASSAAATFADGDTVKIRIIEDDGAIEVYVWVAGAQPISPTLAGPRESLMSDGGYVFADGNGVDAMTVLWDNIVISSWDDPSADDELDPGVAAHFRRTTPLVHRHEPYPVDGFEVVRRGPYPNL